MTAQTRKRLFSRLGAGLVALALAGCQSRSLLESEAGELPSDERPLVVALSGTTGLEPRRLLEAAELDLQDFEDNDWEPSFVEDAAFAIERQLIDQGFLDARVDALVEERPAGRRVEFTVVAGARTRLVSIDIEGLTQFDPRSVLDEFVLTRESDADDALWWYSAAALERGRRGLFSAYLRQGFRDARVQLVEEQPGDLERAVVVVIDAGVQHKLKSVELELEQDAEFSWLHKYAAEFEGRPDTPRLESELRARLERALLEEGYLDAQVEPVATQVTEDGQTTLHYHVQPGAQVNVRNVLIRRLEAGTENEAPRPLRTKSSFVANRLTLGPGDLASAIERDESFERLYATGLFKTVELAFDSEPGTDRDLIVGLEEQPSQEVFVEPGFGTYERARLRAGWRDRNLLGTGRALRVEGLLAQRASSAEIGISDPRLFGENISGDLAVRYDERELPSFTSVQWGASLTASRVLTDRIQVAAIYNWRRSDVRDAALDPSQDPDLAEALDAVDISSILIGPRYDTRDRLFVPQKGAFVRLGLEWASTLLGSEVDFIRPTLTASKFISVDPKRSGVLALSFQAGVVAPIGETNVIPLAERFFLGGSTTVRAFRENELGPEEASGGRVGGEVFGFGSIEYRQQLSGGLHAGIFYDAGTVLRQIEDLRNPSRLRGGPGVGLRYLLPVGPIRLDLGYNVDPRGREDDLVLHIAVGMSF